MYRIVTTDGTELGITDKILYIKKSASGALIVAEKDNAIGIAFESEAYNLEGHSDIAGAKTVTIIETSLTEWAKAKKTSKLIRTIWWLTTNIACRFWNCR